MLLGLGSLAILLFVIGFHELSNLPKDQAIGISFIIISCAGLLILMADYFIQLGLTKSKFGQSTQERKE
jgi:hypothetical protein